MAIEWFYAKDGKQLGPVAQDELRGLATCGVLHSSDLVWKEGMPNWTPAGRIKGLMPSVATHPPAAPPTAADSATSISGSGAPALSQAAIEFSAFAGQLGDKARRTMLGAFSDPQLVPMKMLSMVGKWLCIAVACIFIAASLRADFAPAGAQAAGVACFFAICARLLQAEQYHTQ